MEKKNKMHRILSVLVRNHAGVLSHVAGLFTRRGYNIASLVAGETADPNISRITIVTAGDEVLLDQVSKQHFVHWLGLKCGSVGLMMSLHFPMTEVAVKVDVVDEGCKLLPITNLN